MIKLIINLFFYFFYIICIVFKCLLKYVRQVKFWGKLIFRNWRIRLWKLRIKFIRTFLIYQNKFFNYL